MSTHLGSLIRIFRVRKGLSQADLAAQIGVSPGAIGQWERGEFRPKGKNLNSLKDVLGISLELMEREALKDEEAGSAIQAMADNVATLEESAQLPSEESVRTSHKAMVQYAKNSERLKLAQDKARSTEFDNTLVSLLGNLDANVRTHVAIEGPTGQHWIADCLTHRSVIELKHPRSYPSVEGLLSQTLWRLVVLRSLVGPDRNYIAVVKRPTTDDLPEHGRAFYEQKLVALSVEAELVGISVLVVDSPEQAAKAIEELEHQLDRDRSAS